MKYSDGMCKICMTNAENAEHMLTECISLGNIWNETECLIQITLMEIMSSQANVQ